LYKNGFLLGSYTNPLYTPAIPDINSGRTVITASVEF
jgi:hypothetical protein